MNRIVFDWSLRRGVVAIVISEDGTRVRKDWPSTKAMLDSLTAPHEIIGEATFESYILENRREFAVRCAKEGHLLRTLPSRLTSRTRRALGYQKSDENDVLAMIHLAQDESRLSTYHEPDSLKVDRHEKANGRLMLLRASGLKDPFAQALADRLPEFKSLPEKRHKALGDGKKYNLVKVAAVAVAAEFCSTQREFDQLSGLYAHAYPSQIRADLMHWGWSGGSQRPKLKKELDPSGETDKMVPVVPSVREDGLTLSEYRRSLRWLYRQLRPLVAPSGVTS